jgi:hypothetical protein
MFGAETVKEGKRSGRFVAFDPFASQAEQTRNASNKMGAFSIVLIVVEIR